MSIHSLTIITKALDESVSSEELVRVEWEGCVDKLRSDEGAIEVLDSHYNELIVCNPLVVMAMDHLIRLDSYSEK